MNLILGKEIVKAGISVRVDPALEFPKMVGWVLAFPVRAEFVPCGWWGLAGPGPFIAHIGPDARRRTFLFGLHLDGRVISENGLSGADMPTDGIGQRFQ